MKFVLTGVIPTHQYANLQPTIEVEADTFDEAYSLAMQQMAQVWNDNVEAGKELKPKTDRGILETAFVGGKIWYNDATHSYTNDAGEKYLSGSEYAKQFEKPFDAAMIAGIMAKKVDGVTAQQIQDMWELKSKVSRDFGTALHGAMELYELHRASSEALDKLYHLHDHPVIKNAVESFYASHGNEEAKQEVLVISHHRKWAGRIDRLLITGDKKCRVQDYKTNADVSKSIELYWKQLNFYAQILTDNGWTVEGLDIFHYNGKWTEYSEKVVPINV